MRFSSERENIFGENSIKCSIHKHKKGERIYIWEQSMDLLRRNISEYILKDMQYKINCKYTDTKR